ncbi:unnamed protein product [Trifolium pratense]|uniref:Uncharacterized protein n=1 Tax=Trifolium pratense TaxID=57577 RepID=A0ACB0LJ52_TRIPR|nr:unnamed protein product [Trifolium pratense]
MTEMEHSTPNILQNYQDLQQVGIDSVLYCDNMLGCSASFSTFSTHRCGIQVTVIYLVPPMNGFLAASRGFQFIQGLHL